MFGQIWRPVWQRGAMAAVALGLSLPAANLQAGDSAAWQASVHQALLRVSHQAEEADAASHDAQVLEGVKANLQATLALYQADGNALAAEAVDAEERVEVRKPQQPEQRVRENLRKQARERAEEVRQRAIEAASRRDGEEIVRERVRDGRKPEAERERKSDKPERAKKAEEAKSLPTPHPRVVHALRSQQQQIDKLTKELDALKRHVREMRAHPPEHERPAGGPHGPGRRDMGPPPAGPRLENLDQLRDRHTEMQRQHAERLRQGMQERFEQVRKSIANEEAEAKESRAKLERAMREHQELRAGLDEARHRMQRAQEVLMERERRFAGFEREVAELRSHADRAQRTLEAKQRELEFLERLDSRRRPEMSQDGEPSSRRSRKPTLPADAI